MVGQKDLLGTLQKLEVEHLPRILPLLQAEVLDDYRKIITAIAKPSSDEKNILAQVVEEMLRRSSVSPEILKENGCPNTSSGTPGIRGVPEIESTKRTHTTTKSANKKKIQDPVYVELIKSLARAEIYDNETGNLTQSIPSHLRCVKQERTQEDWILASCGYLNTQDEEEGRQRLSRYASSLRKRISGGNKRYNTAQGESKTVTTKGVDFKTIYKETFPDGADPCGILECQESSPVNGTQNEQEVSEDDNHDMDFSRKSSDHFPFGSLVFLLSPQHGTDEEQFIVYKIAEGISCCIGGLSCKCHENLQVRITAIEANPWQADNRRALSTPVNGASIDISKLCIDNFETCPVSLVESKSRSAKEINDEAEADIELYMEKRSKIRSSHSRREEDEWLKSLEQYASAWLEKYPGREVPRPSQGDPNEEVDSLANWISRLVSIINGKGEGKDANKRRHAYILLTTTVKEILHREDKDWWIKKPRKQGRPKKSKDLIGLPKKRRLKCGSPLSNCDVPTPPLATTSSRGRTRKPKWDATFQYA